MKTILWNEVCNQHFQSHRLELNYPSEVFLHDHDFYEFFIIEAGVVLHHINGKTVEMQVGEGWWICPKDVHRFSIPKGRSGIILNFSFPRKYYAEFSRITPKATDYLKSKGVRNRALSFSAAQATQLTNLLLQAREISNTSLQLYRILSELLTIIVPEEKIETYFPPYMPIIMGSRKNAIPNWLVLLLEKLESPEFFLKEVTELQKISGYSPSRFSQIFKSYMTTTPTNYINKKRILYAKIMMEQTEKPILDIIEELRFKSVAHFYRLFKYHFGTAPGKIRRSRVASLKKKRDDSSHY